MKKTFFAVILSSIVVQSFAKDDLAAKLDGKWSGSGAGVINMQLMVMDVEDGDIAASLTVGVPGCGGGMQGLGKVIGNTLTIRPFKKEQGTEMCMIKAVFDKTANIVTISENQCDHYHGAACAFAGTLKRKNTKL